MNRISWNRIKHLLMMQILDGNSSSKRSLTARFGMGGRLLLLSTVLALAGILMGDDYKNFPLGLCVAAAISPFAFFISKDKNKAVNYLLIPASAKEKIISLFILVTGSVIVFFATTAFMGFALSELMNLAIGDILFTPVSFLIPIDRYMFIFSALSIMYFSILSSKDKTTLLIKFFGIYIVFGIVILIIALWSEALGLQHITTQIIILSTIPFCISLFFWVLGYDALKKREI